MWRSRLVVGAGLLLGAIAPPVLAGAPAHVEWKSCEKGVRVSARDVPLSAVLKRMSEVMDFTLAYQARDDPRVSLDFELRPEDAVTTLASRGNLVAQYERD